MKTLGGVSWDSGSKAGHFSGRDQGSAADTNYKHVSAFFPSPVLVIVFLAVFVQ
jgi:hypothetical protein